MNAPNPPPVSHDPRALLRAMFDAAVAAALPARCVPPALPSLPRGRTLVLGAGKAAAAMAAAVEEHWTGPLSGLVVTRDGYRCPTRRIAVREAGHPIPDARGMSAAAELLALAESARAEDLVLYLISGGASALLTLPAPGVTLEDKQAITDALLRSGARIDEINCVRKHLSRIKGGRLAQAAARARVVTMMISDVVGDDPAVIASGPTVADPTTCRDALDVLDRYGVPISAHIRADLKSGLLETPKVVTSGEVVIVARPRDALEAAARVARAAGYAVHDLGDRCVGEARDVAADHARLVRRIRDSHGPVQPPCVVLSGGELTVTVRGRGAGGPNTEYALALAGAVPGLWALAADTDGTDGGAGAAGAIVTPDTLARAATCGADAVAAMAANDSAGFFRRLGDLVDSGPTFTNVNDFRAIVIPPA